MSGRKITVVGTGYVGMSMAVLLAQHNDVTALDIDEARVDLINQGKSTVVDAEIEQYLDEKELSLTATFDKADAYKDPSFVVVATPTDYDPETNYFDTISVEDVIGDVLAHNETAMIVIKSTVPVGFTRSMKEQFKTDRIIFSPEFLREGRALKDNLYPSRIIMGSDDAQAYIFAGLLRDAAERVEVAHDAFHAVALPQVDGREEVVRGHAERLARAYVGGHILHLLEGHRRR